MRGTAILICLGASMWMKASAEPTFIPVHDAKFVGYILPRASGESAMHWYNDPKWLDPNRGWEPSNDQAIEAERAVHRFMDQAGEDIRIAFPKGTKPEVEWNRPKVAEIRKRYRRYEIQFIGITSHGVREIFCNYFVPSPSDSVDPSRNFVMVFDGGSFYWQIIYVPATKSCRELSINGEA